MVKLMFTRMEILFSVPKECRIPYSYGYKVMANLYRYISVVDSRLEQFLHNQGYRAKSGHCYKFFNHTLLFTNADFLKDGIRLGKDTEVRLIVSGKKDIVMAICNGVFKDRQLIMDDAVLTLKNIVKSPKILFSEIMKYKTLSPVVTSTKNDDNSVEYISICDYEKYFRNLGFNAIRKYETIFEREFNLEKTPLYFDVNQLFSEIKEKRIMVKNAPIKAYLFEPVVECKDIDMQKVIYYLGLGERSSIGFGALTV